MHRRNITTQQPLLRGDRVLLRPWRDDDDADAFAAMNADLRVMELFVAPLSRTESDAMLARMRAYITEHGSGWWCVDINGECAGFTGMSSPPYETPFTPCTEVGWRFRPQYWGHGYATEAARLALNYGFKVIQLNEIVSFTTATNHPSRRVMERLGMRRDVAGDFEHPRAPMGNSPPRPLSSAQNAVENQAISSYKGSVRNSAKACCVLICSNICAARS